MKSLKNKLWNALCHIVIDGQLQPKFLMVSYLLMALQTMACLVSTDSTFYLVVKWADPSTFMTPAFSVMIGFVLVCLFLLIVGVKTAMAEDSEMLVRPTTMTMYLGNIFVHIQILCKTVLMVPLLRSCMIALSSPQNTAIKWLALVAMLLYLILVLPVLLFSSSNTFILTPQINKKVNYLNIYIIFHLFRLVFAMVSVANLSMRVVPCSLFFLVFILLTLKQPVYIYSNEKLVKGIISAVAYVSLVPLLECIMGSEFNSLLIEFVGIASFVAFVQGLSQWRMRRILDLPQPTIHQLKLLTFMVINIEQYIQQLQYFILKHHKECTHVACKCAVVVQLLAAVEGKPTEEKVWYEFLVSYAGNHYSLGEIQKLPESEMRRQTEKYSRIVVDLAEIHLFKLGQTNLSYYLVDSFRHHLESQGISCLSFVMKQKIIKHYLQEEMQTKFKKENAANPYADTYMGFQIEYERYRKTLLRSANKTAEMWQQMNKREPDGQKLRRSIKLLEGWHWRIRAMYQHISTAFDKSAEILEPITNRYFECVLNIGQKSPFHVVAVPRFESLLKRKGERVEKMSENMQAFSLDSETPLCFVSVDKDSYGKITRSNHFFNEVMKVEFGKTMSVDDFLIPDMRVRHRERMEGFVERDGYITEHASGFALNSKEKLIYTKVLVQVVPSIAEGLRYVFYFRKMMPQCRVLAVKNNFAVAYSSESFDQAFAERIRRISVQSFLTEEVLAQLRGKREAKAVIDGQSFPIRFLYEFTHSELSYLFLQFYECENQPQIYSGLQASKLRDSTQLKSSGKIRAKGESIVFGEEKQLQVVNQKQKKEEEGMREVFSIIVGQDKKNITRRVVIFTLVIFSLFVAVLVAAIVLRQQNQQLYLGAADTNTDYSNFMLLLSRAVTYAKLTNINAYQNRTVLAKAQFSILANLTSVNPVMDQLVVDFDISPITQIWDFFSWNTNGSFRVDQEGNFLTVSDVIQNPLTNIVAQSLSSLSFPIARQYLSLPLTAAQYHLQMLVTNSLYLTIPNFRALKADVMDPMKKNEVNTMVPMLLVFLVQILIVVFFVVGMLVINKRVTELKYESYRLFESLSRQFIREKEERCREFVSRFTAVDEEDVSERGSGLRVMNRYDTRMELQNSRSSRQSQREFHERTEHELGVGLKTENELEGEENSATNSNVIVPGSLGMETRQFHQNVLKTGGQQNVGQAAAKTEEIFEKASLGFVLFKYLLPVVPLLLFSVTFASLQARQVDRVNNFLSIQANIQTLQLDINLIHLYALHYGVYDQSMETYRSIPSTLNALVNQMYLIQRAMVGKTYDLGGLPLTQQFIGSIGYADLCQMFAAGVFLNGSISNNSFSMGECMGIGDAILQKGFYSSMINYLEGVGTLLLANPNMPLASLAQRLQYLNSRFFSANGPLIGYFDSIISTILSVFQQDYTKSINDSTNSLFYTAVGMLVLLLVLAVCFKWLYLQSFRNEIVEITAIFLLVSYGSLLRSEGLRRRFLERMRAFRKLK